MTDAISRSAVLEILCNGCNSRNNTPVPRCGDMCSDFKEVLNLPALDVAPVVRCVDCKYRCTLVCPMYHTETCLDDLDGFDDYDVDRTDDDGFCHLGERWECEEDAAD